MLSAVPADAAAAAGFVPVTWNGQQTYAKAGEWILSVGGAKHSGGDDRQVLAAVNAVLGRLRGDVQATRPLGDDGHFLLKSPRTAHFDELRQALRQMPGFEYLEPNFLLSADQAASDPKYTDGTLWGLNNANDADVDAPEAWDLTTGSQAAVVGVVDTGVDYKHPDLYQNIWINQAEIPSAIRSGLTDIDADGAVSFLDLNDPANQGPGKISDLNANGFIDGGDLLNDASGWEDGADAAGDPNAFPDDLVGWNFVSDTNDPYDDQGHGTHVAGTIAARGNNGLGVVGVNWKAQVMGLKFLAADGYGTGADAIQALNYTTDLHDAGVNINVTNHSYGGEPFSAAFYDAIRRNQESSRGGMLFVAAAGNGDWRGRAINNDTTPHYPSSYGDDALSSKQPGYAPLENVVAVTATDSNDAKASFANYGAKSVDLGAPGVNIYSLAPGGYYKYNNGTSMASPHVAGAAALGWTLSPAATYGEVKNGLMSGVDLTTAMSSRTVSGGRLNVNNALAKLPPSTPPAVPAGLAAAAVSSSRVDVRWNDVVGESSYTLKRYTKDPLTGVPVGETEITGIASNATAYSDTGLKENTTYYYQVKASNAAGASAYSAESWAATPVYVQPAQPIDLSAVSDDSTSRVHLAWTHDGTNTSGFKIHRSTDPSFGRWTEITLPGADVATHVDTGLSAGTTYYYRVYAYNASADSEPSNTATAATAAPWAVGTGDGVTGEYFDNADFTNHKATRTDASGINFNWGTGSPVRGIKSDTFSVRWRGVVQPRFDEAYTFYTHTDDGVRLWVNGDLVINIWGRANTSQYATGALELKAGQTYDIRMDYYENGGGASAKLSWSSASVPKQVIPGSQLYTYGKLGTAAPAPAYYDAPPASNDEIGTWISSVGPRRPAAAGPTLGEARAADADERDEVLA